jgi:hypothetical protein
VKSQSVSRQFLPRPKSLPRRPREQIVNKAVWRAEPAAATGGCSSGCAATAGEKGPTARREEIVLTSSRKKTGGLKGRPFFYVRATLTQPVLTL